MDAPTCNDVLAFWFADREQDAPTLDSRMNRWFDGDPQFDAELTERFGALAARAALGELDDWAETPRGRLALILLVGQFPRHIHKGSKAAFAGDRRALKLCEQGVANNHYRKLQPIEQLFFFMPLQRAESMKVQKTSVKVFNSLSERVSATMRDTFETVAHFAELRHDIIAEFGRFPHRNVAMGRQNTGEEESYLSA